MSNDPKASMSKVGNITKSLSDLRNTIGELEDFENILTGTSQTPSNEVAPEPANQCVGSIINGVSSELENLNTRISQVIIRLKEILI